MDQNPIQPQQAQNISPYHPHKGLIKAMIILAVAVFCFFVGYLAYSQVLKSDEEGVFCTQDAKICPDGTAVGRVGPLCEFAACSETDSSAVDTSNWQTYHNEEFGFEFKYPVDWVLHSEIKPQEIGPIIALNFASPAAQAGPNYDSYGGELDIAVWQNPYNEPIEEFYAFKHLKQETAGEIKQTEINGNPVKIFRSVVGNFTSDIAIIIDDGWLIEIRYSGDPAVLLDQILSTFRFIQ